ncbi:putative protease (putative secreted protein) [Vulgatibacter incomptus]|uniref:Putative protease (Putative secreted protein) n=1 Tax=Vulgatibacter incomptus TaxID=1391653 RepID=A0A0K1PBD6_9BACT|nr:putative protease (putative secreted protein) [Vulgatibacter incomptus]
MTWTSCNRQGLPLLCTTLEVPLDWSRPEGQRIPYFVQKATTTKSPKLGQIWLLVGGPGYSGDGILGGAQWFTSLGFDVYVPDYRGTGRSAPLGCDGESASSTSQRCLAELAQIWGDDLASFSTTGAALDLGKTIERFREPGGKVFVFGASYGTYLANRYMNLFPERADGVVLAGICPPTGCSVRADRTIDLVARDTFAACSSDAFCTSKLGSDPWQTLEAVYEKLRHGHCSALAGAQSDVALSGILGGTLGERSLAPVALAAAYRADRCDPKDVTALKALGRQVAPWIFGLTTSNQPFSEYLYMHIVMSEFFDGITPDDLRDEAARLTVAPGYEESMARARENWPWPLYETPSELKRWAPVSTPMLMINGTLDSATPIVDLAGIEEAFPGATQTFVRVPNEGHGAFQQSCPLAIVADFVQDPSAPLDLGCLSALETLDLRGSSDLARQAFGTGDLWENTAQAAMAEGPAESMEEPTDPGLLRAIENARSAIRPRW